MLLTLGVLLGVLIALFLEGVLLTSGALRSTFLDVLAGCAELLFEEGAVLTASLLFHLAGASHLTDCEFLDGEAVFCLVGCELLVTSLLLAVFILLLLTLFVREELVNELLVAVVPSALVREPVRLCSSSYLLATLFLLLNDLLGFCLS